MEHINYLGFSNKFKGKSGIFWRYMKFKVYSVIEYVYQTLCSYFPWFLLQNVPRKGRVLNRSKTLHRSIRKIYKIAGSVRTPPIHANKIFYQTYVLLLVSRSHLATTHFSSHPVTCTHIKWRRWCVESPGKTRVEIGLVVNPFLRLVTGALRHSGSRAFRLRFWSLIMRRAAINLYWKTCAVNQIKVFD